MRIATVFCVVILFGLSAQGQTVINGDFNDSPDFWDCDLTGGLGVEVNFESVYGGTSTTNFVAEVDVTVGLCQSIDGFIPGEVYELTFDCSGRTSTCGPVNQSMLVTIDGGVLSESVSKSNVDFELQNERYCFTATQTTHLLLFASTTMPEVSCGVVVDNIEIIPYSVNLGEDQVLCEGEETDLDASAFGTSYLWQDGSTNPTYNVTSPGTYSVEVFGEFCPFSEDIVVSYITLEPDLGPDLILCEGDNITLDVSSTNASYEWQDGSTNATLFVDEPGQYSVDVSVGNCTVNETIDITYNTDQVDLGDDISLCAGETVSLVADVTDADYVWQDGSTGSTYDVDESGTYTVTATVGSCSSTDEIMVSINNDVVDLGNDVTLCSGELLNLNAGYPGASYLWQDGSTNQMFEVSTAGTYSVDVTNGDCTISDEIVVSYDLLNVDLGVNQTLCVGETITLDATNEGATYSWQDGSGLSTYTVSQEGTYSVVVTGTACTVSDEIDVAYNDVVVNLGVDVDICDGESFTFDATTTDGTYLWQDGSTDATLTTDQAGSYSVEVSVNGCTGTDEANITLTDIPDVDLGEDQFLCNGQNIVLNATWTGATYEWQDGSSNSTFSVNQAGTYSVDVNENGCSASDEIIITYSDLTLDLGGDQSLCEGESTLLDATNVNATYLWQDGSTDPTFEVSESGTYSVTVSQNGCTIAESVDIDFGTLEINLGADLSVCDGGPVILDATIAGATYLWQDGSSSPTFTVTETGTYAVDVSSGSCTSSDEINVVINNLTLDLGGNQSLCEGESVLLDATNDGGTYLWQDGSTDPTFEVTTSGTYAVTATQGDCTVSESVEITFGTLEVDLGSDQISCDTDPVILDATTSGASYLWQDGSTNPTFAVVESGTYSVEISAGSCTAYDEILVEFGELNLNLGGDQSLCEGEIVLLDATNDGGTYLWQDGSTDPTFEVTTSGTYSVTVTQGDCTVSESVEITFGTLYVDLGDDATLCAGQSLTLDPAIAGGDYIWQDGSMSETFVVTEAGLYSVQVTSGSCTASDEIQVDFGSLSISLGSDTTLCDGEELILDPQITDATFIWQDGSSESSLTVTQSGMYSVEVNSGTCSATDEISVVFNEIPSVDLGPDASFCTGQEITLDASYPNATYLWQNSATAATFVVDEAGTYSVDVTAGGCTGYDNITISFGSINVDLGDDVAMCEGESITLDATTTDASYLWSDGSTNATLSVTQSGNYNVTVTTDECVGTDNIVVNIGDPTIELGNDTILCAGESLLLDVFTAGAMYLWQNGSTDSEFVVTENGLYTVEIMVGDCSAEDEINISFADAPGIDLGPDQQICEGSNILLDATWPNASYVWNDLSTEAILTTNISGTYWVTVTSQNCTTTDTISVTTGLPNIDLGNDTTLCAGTAFTLSPTSFADAYLWQDGSTESTFVVSGAGIYSVQIEMNGCLNSDSIVVEYAPLPAASISGGMIHCPDEMVNLAVDITGTPPFLLGFTKDGVPLTSVETSAYSYQLSTDESGVYEVSSVIDAFCYAGPQNNTAITDYPPLTLDFNYDSAICVDENVSVFAQVTGGNGDDYTSQWIDVNGQEYFTNPLTLIGQEDITLNYTASDLCGSIIEGIVNIEVQVPPIPQIFTSVDSICTQTTVLFESNNDDENVNCIWVFDDNSTEFGCGPIEQNYSQNGFHSVSLTMQTSAGCEHTTTIDSVIYVLPNPNAGFTFLASEGTTLSPGIQFNNGSSYAETWSWDFGDGHTSNEESPLHIYPYDEAEEYIACITAVNELGCEDTQCHIVEIEPDLIIHIPNSFTPNEDGVNDLFKPVLNDVVLAEYEFRIYDRGGIVIFESHDQNQFWNGSNPTTTEYYVPDGVYNYQIILREEDESDTKEYRGNITLIR